MALNSATVWELRTTGSSLNGGGFRSGTGGTDYSQQDAAQLSVADATASGTTTLTSATGGFTAAMVGNVVQISGGTLTAGFYEIISVTNSNTVVLDRTAGTGSGSTLKVGGALAGIATAVAAMVNGNTLWIKAGTHTLANATLTPASWSTPNPMIINGYNATRGDLEGATTFGSMPVIQKSAGAENIFTFSGTCQRLRCVVLDGNGLAANGTSASGASAMATEFCQAKNFTSFGFSTNGNFNRCHATANGAGGFSATAVCGYDGCVAYANTGPGFVTNSSNYTFCIAYGNTGASSHGFSATSTAAPNLTNCVAYGNGGDGLRLSNAQAVGGAFARNCIFAANGGYGVNNSTGNQPTIWSASNRNAFWNNTSGARNALPAGANDVTLTGDPFVNAASGNFALNNTAGAGAACRAAGSPGPVAGGTTTGYLDIGVAQHQDPTGGGGGGLVVGSSIIRPVRSSR